MTAIVLSTRYRELHRRLGELRRLLLPARFDAMGTYSERIHERSRAYRVLVHAEFESYIEDRVSEVAQDRFTKWRASRQSSRCIIGLIAYRAASEGSSQPTSILSPPQRSAPLIDDRVSKAKDELVTYAKTRNHGVRETNLLRLLLPLGIEIGDLDKSWLSTIDSWATRRGEYAHNSRGQLTVLADPQDELDLARQILAGFKTLDKLMSTI